MVHIKAGPITLQTPQFVPIAGGDTAQGRANGRGHLFEIFVARVFEAYGCSAPTKSDLNVTTNGYELDIVTTIRLTGARAIAECKAYSSNVPQEALSKFYGKLCAERLDGTEVNGWFVALPGMTSDGYQLARKIESLDPAFKLIDAEGIFRLLVEKSMIDPTPPSWPHSDLAIVIAEHGLYLAAKRLDVASRLPIAVHLWSSASKQQPPEPVRRLLADSDYAIDLPVNAEGELGDATESVVSADYAQQLVSVYGSSGDFEYQYPASPQFFIGRKELLSEINQRFAAAERTGQVLVLNAQSGWGKSSFALKLSGVVEAMDGVSLILDSRTASSPSYVWAAMQDLIAKAEDKAILKRPDDASFGSLRSCIETLRTCELLQDAPMLLFFDQFENVFRDPRLTQEFRDLALAIRDVKQPIIVGFAWKTDLVGWTERYPYQLRDEIRGVASVFQIDPFGPSELGVILSRLSNEAGFALSKDLRQRLREYSQGLPWLIKKLATYCASSAQVLLKKV